MKERSIPRAPMTRVIFLLCLLPALSWAASPEALVRESKAYVEKGEIQSAIIQLKNALQKDPDYAEARRLLGEIYLDGGNGPAAEKELARARDLGLERDQWLLLLARAYLLQNKFNAVLEALRADDESDANFGSEVVVLRGSAYRALGKTEQASEHFGRALELNPKNAEAYLGFARLAASERKLDEALKQIGRAIRLDDTNADAWLLKGEVERVNSDFETATKSFSQALAIRPRNPQAHLGKAVSLIALKQFDAAGQEVDAVLKDYPQLPMANYLSAVVAFQGGRIDQAQEALLNVLQVAPNHLPSHLLMGAIYYAKNELEAAQEHLKRYTKSDDQHIPALKLLAATHVKLGQIDAAIAVLESIRSRIPAEPQVLAILGSAYIQKGEFSKGTEMLQAAVEIAPDMAAIHTQLALGHLASGATEQAVDELQTAVDLGQGLVQADILLALTHLKNKDYERALSVATEFTRKNPNNPLAFNILGSIYTAMGESTQARENFAKAMEIQPGFVAAAMNLALLDIDAGDLKQAEARYKDILKHDPGYTSAMLGLARLAERDGREQDMVDWLERAREADPKAIRPRVVLVNYFLKHQEPLKGVTVARELVTANPNNPLAVKILGLALMSHKDYGGAAIYLRKLTELQPKSPDAYHLLANAELSHREYDNARAALDKALALAPDNLTSLVTKAKLELQIGNRDAALQIAEQIQEKHPTTSVGYQLEGEILMQDNRFSEAAKRFERGYVQKPSAQLALLLHSAHKGAGDYEASLDALRNWLDEHADDVPVRMALALAYQGANAKAEAIREYEQVIERAPQNVIVLNNLAWLYTGKGDPRGVEYGERAYELKPENPEVVDTYAWALLNSGQVERGVVLLQQAAVQAPHIPEIQYHLAVGLNKAGRTQEARKELERLLRSKATFADRKGAKALLERLE